MSTLWTPDGERPIRREPQPEAPSSPYVPGGPPGPGAQGAPGGPAGPLDGGQSAEPTPEEQEAMLAQLEAMRQQLADVPAEVVVANHAYGIFELAAVHLSTAPPQLDQARFAIDALAALVEGLAGRLGESEPSLRDGLAQLRMAFVEVSKLPQAPAGS